MKLKLSKPVVEAFAAMCVYTYHINFEDKITKFFLRKHLESLIVKLSRCKVRITHSKSVQNHNRKPKTTGVKEKTVLVTLNETECFVFSVAAATYSEHHPQALETLLANKYFFNEFQQSHA